MNKIYWILVVLLFSCKAKQYVIEDVKTPESDPQMTIETSQVEDEPETEFRVLDELTVTAPRGFTLPRYNPSASREFDLIHTSLDLRFDWVNEQVIGRADLTLTPYFYPRSSLTLDAKGFDIIDVSGTEGESLAFEYDNAQLTIDLQEIFEREDTVDITIDYIAKPSEGPEGGSAAITSDKGLFFINPRNEEINKPQQIWTQGETENNSRWFPTIDKPNENSTQEVRITVDNRFKTLSNGELVSSTLHKDGKRTDYWKMDEPHAPYLFMLAIGEFAVVRDQWNDVELEYYVEPEYEAYAKDIFKHTPEMLSFFSAILDYPYPWNKFSQVITRDYVSGAMENTTAVIYGEFIQKTDRELIDNANDYIIAHEMFHHWFGDLVTCESWANLTLQEGMANYSEHLWQEYKYGLDDAGYQRMNELNGYLGSIQQTGIHPLIHYGYGDKEEMFDGHSYNKGGLVLHMLRKHIGDEAFFVALNKYLVDNAYTAVEADELRMAFEDVYGEDLNWFFDQWYLKAGHPVFEISSGYDTLEGTALVNIIQTQDPEANPPIFQVPVAISLYDSQGRETIYDAWITRRNQTLRLPFDEAPALVIFDRDDVLLYEKKETKGIQEYIRQYNWSPVFKHRYEAIQKLGFKKESQPVLLTALEDDHFSIRKLALSNLRFQNRPEILARIESMAVSDPHSEVRGAAIKKLRNQTGYDLKPLLERIFENERAYPVLSAALESLNRIDKEGALQRAVDYKKEKTSLMVGAVSAVLAASGDTAHVDYFQDKLTNVSLFQVFEFYDSYYRLVGAQSPGFILEQARSLKKIALKNGMHLYYKFLATNTINRLKNDLKSKDADISNTLGAMIEEIKAGETNEVLIQRYQMY